MLEERKVISVLLIDLGLSHPIKLGSLVIFFLLSFFFFKLGVLGFPKVKLSHHQVKVLYFLMFVQFILFTCLLTKTAVKNKLRRNMNKKFAK